MKIEITWNKPDGTKPMVGFQTDPNDDRADDEQLQIDKALSGAQAHFHKQTGAAPPVSQLSVQTFSVNFTFLPLTDPRLQPEATKAFIKVGQLVGWELPRRDQIYTGHVIVGEKTVPEGFQTMADFALDVPEKPISFEKSKQIAQTVMREFQQRGQLSITTPAQA